MPESAQIDKEKTSNDRFMNLGKRIPIMILSQKLPQELTGVGRNLTSFWTE
jgi:hypothetical protein